MFSGTQIATAEFVRNQTPPDALFLTGPTYHQPVASLAGRSVLRANMMWPWSHGYQFRERETDVRRIYAAAPDARELLRYYAIDYVYLSELERNELSANEAALDAWFPVVFRAGDIKIYRAGDDTDRSGGRSHKPAPRELATRIPVDPSAYLAEFERLGFFIYRLYDVSLDRPPRCEEFTADLQALGRNLYVGAPGWDEALERNKISFVDEWCRQPGRSASPSGVDHCAEGSAGAPKRFRSSLGPRALLRLSAPQS